MCHAWIYHQKLKDFEATSHPRCCVSFSVFCFSDVRTTEIKLQLNNAAGGRLRRNKILFYFRRPTHIAETETKTLKQPETVFSVRTS